MTLFMDLCIELSTVLGIPDNLKLVVEYVNQLKFMSLAQVIHLWIFTRIIFH